MWGCLKPNRKSKGIQKEKGKKQIGGILKKFVTKNRDLFSNCRPGYLPKERDGGERGPSVADGASKCLDQKLGGCQGLD